MKQLVVSAQNGYALFVHPGFNQALRQRLEDVARNRMKHPSMFASVFVLAVRSLSHTLVGYCVCVFRSKNNRSACAACVIVMCLCVCSVRSHAHTHSIPVSVRAAQGLATLMAGWKNNPNERKQSRSNRRK